MVKHNRGVGAWLAISCFIAFLPLGCQNAEHSEIDAAATDNAALAPLTLASDEVVLTIKGMGDVFA